MNEKPNSTSSLKRLHVELITMGSALRAGDHDFFHERFALWER